MHWKSYANPWCEQLHLAIKHCNFRPRINDPLTTRFLIGVIPVVTNAISTGRNRRIDRYAFFFRRWRSCSSIRAGTNDDMHWFGHKGISCTAGTAIHKRQRIPGSKFRGGCQSIVNICLHQIPNLSIGWIVLRPKGAVDYESSRMFWIC